MVLTVFIQIARSTGLLTKFMCRFLYDNKVGTQKILFFCAMISSIAFDCIIHVDSSNKMHHKEDHVLSQLIKIIDDDKVLECHKEESIESKEIILYWDWGSSTTSSYQILWPINCEVEVLQYFELLGPVFAYDNSYYSSEILFIFKGKVYVVKFDGNHIFACVAGSWR